MFDADKWTWAGLLASAAVVVLVTLSIRRRRERHPGDHERPRGGTIDDLNHLLKEGSISPEEYELLKRRILAGHVP